MQQKYLTYEYENQDPPIPQRKQWNKRMNIRGPLFLKKPYVLCFFFSVFSCWSDLLLVYVGGWYEIRSSLFMSLFVKTVFTMGTNIIVVFSLSDLSINKVWVIILDEIGASYKLTKKKFPLKKATSKITKEIKNILYITTRPFLLAKK